MTNLDRECLEIIASEISKGFDMISDAILECKREIKHINFEERWLYLWLTRIKREKRLKSDVRKLCVGSYYQFVPLPVRQ